MSHLKETAAVSKRTPSVLAISDACRVDSAQNTCYNRLQGNTRSLCKKEALELFIKERVHT